MWKMCSRVYAVAVRKEKKNMWSISTEEELRKFKDAGIDNIAMW